LNIFRQCAVIFIGFISPVFSAIGVEQKQPVNTVSYTHIVNWSLGLIVVLLIFFACIWFMKKMGALPVNANDGMRVVSGLSLGMREKLVLVQIGEKQLVLGVTPGRVEKLLVLEGEDTLFQQRNSATESEFSQKFKKIMSGKVDE